MAEGTTTATFGGGRRQRKREGAEVHGEDGGRGIWGGRRQPWTSVNEDPRGSLGGKQRREARRQQRRRWLQRRTMTIEAMARKGSSGSGEPGEEGGRKRGGRRFLGDARQRRWVEDEGSGDGGRSQGRLRAEGGEGDDERPRQSGGGWRKAPWRRTRGSEGDKRLQRQHHRFGHNGSGGRRTKERETMAANDGIWWRSGRWSKETATAATSTAFSGKERRRRISVMAATGRGKRRREGEQRRGS